MLIDNLFISPDALENSNYLQEDEKGEIKSLSRQSVKPGDKGIFRQLRKQVKDDSFPCLAAKASLSGKSYRFGIYSTLAEKEVSQGLAMI